MQYLAAQNDGETVFVFGSNLAGRHGAGAALEAKIHWGAKYGQGSGRQGMSYAIPTKSGNLVTLPLKEIQTHVAGFLWYAKKHPELTFLVTRVGCGLAGYQDREIAPFFRGAPANCVFPEEWAEFLS